MPAPALHCGCQAHSGSCMYRIDISAECRTQRMTTSGVPCTRVWSGLQEDQVQLHLVFAVDARHIQVAAQTATIATSNFNVSAEGAALGTAACSVPCCRCQAHIKEAARTAVTAAQSVEETVNGGMWCTLLWMPGTCPMTAQHFAEGTSSDKPPQHNIPTYVHYVYGV
jgi:hypothetical protein